MPLKVTEWIEKLIISWAFICGGGSFDGIFKNQFKNFIMGFKKSAWNNFREPIYQSDEAIS